MKRKVYSLLALTMLLSALPLSGCTSSDGPQGFRDNVLRIASWDEYIDMGGEDSYYYDKETNPDVKPIYEEFEKWYSDQMGRPITVEYIPLQDNETMYNKIKMGDKYDLLCPSEYMAQKLKDEGYLQEFPKEFFLPTEGNYYAQNVSKYTTDTFIAEADLTGYMAGYMWGTTGFVYNPFEIGKSPENAREIMKSWHCLSSAACKRKITAKDNARDSYFMGLGMHYEDELLALQSQYNTGSLTLNDYKRLLKEKMNDTTPTAVKGARTQLKKARKNLYGLETDEGKMNLVSGRTNAAYQWSGDAVFILDEAEDEADLFLEYSIPEAASNIWFDGWVMMKGANTDLATAFINYVSRTENAVRNMYYIGYTSCLGGQDVYDYVKETYSADETCEENTTEYDLSYFFGAEYEPLIVPESQQYRQLFAQYPTYETTHRLVVMQYFQPNDNERVNRMWNNIK
jgi:spermidine/putrescine transport system substrate-binding protein